MPAVAEIRLSVQFVKDGKQRRITGIGADQLASVLGDVLHEKIEVAQAQAVLEDLVVFGRSVDPLTSEAERERRRAYNKSRKAKMTPEQVEKEKASRAEYNKRRQAQIKEAMALLKAQQNGKATVEA